MLVEGVHGRFLDSIIVAIRPKEVLYGSNLMAYVGGESQWFICLSRQLSRWRGEESGEDETVDDER